MILKLEMGKGKLIINYNILISLYSENLAVVFMKIQSKHNV